MKLNPRKLKRQQEIVNVLWKKSGWVGTLKAIMGFGKTYCGKLAIDKLNAKYPDEKTIVVVPSEPIFNTWMGYIRDFDLKNVEVMTVHMAIRETRECHLLILDEIHRYLDGEEWGKVRHVINYKKLLGLSGTIHEEHQRKLEGFAPVFAEVNWHEGLKEGYISNFTMHNIPITMDEVHYAAYKKYSSDLGKAMAFFGGGSGGFTRMTKMLSKEGRASLSYWISRSNMDEGRLIGYAKRGREATGKRQNLIRDYYGRYDALRKLIPLHKGKVLTFSMVNEMTDKVTEMFPGSYSYHTAIKPLTIKGKKLSRKKTKEHIIEMFNKGRIQQVNATKALNEGITIEGLETGYSVSSNSTQSTLEQRLGRFIRYAEGKHAHMYYLYIKNTMEERQWKTKSQKNIKRYVQEYRTLGEVAEQIQSISR